VLLRYGSRGRNRLALSLYEGVWWGDVVGANCTAENLIQQLFGNLGLLLGPRVLVHVSSPFFFLGCGRVPATTGCRAEPTFIRGENALPSAVAGAVGRTK
jgi:hypothetical protein